MKILWFSNTACSASEQLLSGQNRGGWLVSLEKELKARHDIDLYIAFYYTKKIEPFFLDRTYFFPIYRKYSGSRFSRLYKRLVGENNDQKEIKDLLQIINQINPDLIHIHGTEENFGLIQNHINIPTIISIQGILNSIVEKFYSGIPRKIVSKKGKFVHKLVLKSANYQFKKLKRNAQRERKILRLSNYILGRTDFDRRVTSLLAPNSKYFTSHEILRPSFYENFWSKSQFNETILLFSILSDSNYKGFETILKASIILCTGSHFKFRWFVGGLNEASEIVVNVERWMKTCHKDVYINLLGNISESEIIDHLTSSDIFCQVSHIENSPNSLCEAMIVGIPCIASFAGGTSSLLENNKEGVLFQDGDAFALAGAITEISKNFKIAFDFGKNAGIRAQKRHNKNEIVQGLLNIYKTVIEDYKNY